MFVQIPQIGKNPKYTRSSTQGVSELINVSELYVGRWWSFFGPVYDGLMICVIWTLNDLDICLFPYTGKARRGQQIVATL